MKTQQMAVSINRAENRFEIETEGKLSFITYTPIDDRTLVLTHAEVQPAQERKGIGSELVKGMFNYIENHHLKIITSCSFVETFLKNHPEYNHLVSSDFQKKP